MIYKGMVSSIDGTKARIIPSGEKSRTVPDITIPDNLNGKIEKGTYVVYAYFDDGEGIILSRMDGR